jgi:uncharacterized protein YcbX
MRVGTVKQIWRYPVKSMGGERLERLEVGRGGIPGDRAWAVRDEGRGGIRGAKKIPGLMRCKARYPEPPTVQRVGPAEITLPDGTTFMSDATEAATRLSKVLGQPVTLWPLLPADQLDHYRRGAPTYRNLEQELRSVFALEPDEPLPDLSVFPPEIMEFESPPGTYFDAFPLLLLTDASLAKLQSLAPRSIIDVRRFRPNFLIAAEGEGFVETSWPGKKLRIGAVTVNVTLDCPRCVMPTLDFDDLPKDPTIMRTLVREAGQKLGVYATIATPGAVAVGDVVELVQA